MSIISVIKNRRSIRKYKNIDIPYEEILNLIEAARWAPSAGNFQNWYFIIVKDPKKKKKLMEYADGQEFIREAPVVIVVCSNTKLLESYYGDRGRFYSIQNVAAAIENLLLEATARGYGTCWVGKFDEEKIKELLEIPKDIEVHALITVGYPNENPTSQRKSITEITFFERWGNREYKPTLYPILDKLQELYKNIKENIKKL